MFAKSIVLCCISVLLMGTSAFIAQSELAASGAPALPVPDSVTAAQRYGMRGQGRRQGPQMGNQYGRGRGGPGGYGRGRRGYGQGMQYRGGAGGGFGIGGFVDDNGAGICDNSQAPQVVR